MTVVLTSEDDLWRLFGGEGPETQGVTELPYADFYERTAVLDVNGKKAFRPRFRVSNTTRLYLLRGPGVEAAVDQARLYAMAGKIGAADLMVGYLGQSEADPAYLTPAPQPKKTPLRQKAASGPKPVPAEEPTPWKDSVDKIVTSYFAALTAEPFSYKGKEYLPRDLYVSPLILRGYTCPEGCGGCCGPRFSLDYIAPDSVPEGEKHPLIKRVVQFDGRQVEVWSDMQKDHNGAKCRNLNLDNGRCGIHGSQPFSCDFELLRTIMAKESPRAMFMQKLYGRGWNMLRVDGERGALCEMTAPTPQAREDVERRLARLETWMTHFGLNPKRVSYIRLHLDQIAETGEALNITDETNLD